MCARTVSHKDCVNARDQAVEVTTRRVYNVWMTASAPLDMALYAMHELGTGNIKIGLMQVMQPSMWRRSPIETA